MQVLYTHTSGFGLWSTMRGDWLRGAVQVMYNSGEAGVSKMEYDQEQCESALQAFFHEMEDLEYRGNWCRCWWV